jgi:lipopolysaccharide export system permease protein
LHAAKINQQEWVLKSLNALFFDDEDNFLKRIDAKQATLEPGRWMFRDVNLYEPGKDPAYQPHYALPTPLTAQEVEDSFSTPGAMSFWRLPAHIRTLEETGFDASRLRVRYHDLLAQPLMFAAMILLAATVSLRPPRLRGAAALFGAGIFIGFFVFFMSTFLQAMGSSHQLPVILAAWSPALICFLLGLSVVMAMEDG